MNTLKIRWFPLLRGSEEKELPALLDHTVLDSHSLVVCQQLTGKNGEVTRSFAKFNDYLDFARYHVFAVKPSHQCFYEVIFGASPQKPYFDLDVKLSHPGVASEDLMLTPEESKELHDQVIAGILKTIPVAKEDILVFTSHSSEKHSYHIIVDHWCFPDHEENRAFSLKVAACVAEKYRPFIDASMYKSIQQLRILGSHKFGSDRVKIFSPENTWTPPIPSADENHLFVLRLAGSLVSNVGSCRILPSFAEYVPKKHVVYESDDLTHDEIERCLQICATVGQCSSPLDEKFPYKFQEVKGTLIVLKRLKRSRCQVCHRDHDSENPFLTVVGISRDVYFNCRRSTERLYLGSLGASALPAIAPLSRISVPSASVPSSIPSSVPPSVPVSIPSVSLPSSVPVSIPPSLPPSVPSLPPPPKVLLHPMNSGCLRSLRQMSACRANAKILAKTRVRTDFESDDYLHNISFAGIL